MSARRIEVAAASEERATAYRNAVNKVTTGKLPDGQKVVLVHMKNNFVAIMDDCPRTVDILTSHRLRYADKGRGERVKRVVAFSRSPEHLYKSIFVHLLVFIGDGSASIGGNQFLASESAMTALSFQLIEHINGDQLDLTRANLRRRPLRSSGSKWVSGGLVLRRNPKKVPPQTSAALVSQNPYPSSRAVYGHHYSAAASSSSSSSSSSSPIHPNTQTVPVWTGICRHESMKAWMVQWREGRENGKGGKYLMESFFDKKYGTSRLALMAAMVFYKRKLSLHGESEQLQQMETVVTTTTTTVTTNVCSSTNTTITTTTPPPPSNPPTLHHPSSPLPPAHPLSPNAHPICLSYSSLPVVSPPTIITTTTTTLTTID